MKEMPTRQIWMTKDVERVLAKVVVASEEKGLTITHEQAAQRLIELGIQYSKMVAREKAEDVAEMGMTPEKKKRIREEVKEYARGLGKDKEPEDRLGEE